MMFRRSLGATLLALLLSALCARADQAAASPSPASTQKLTAKVDDGLDVRFANGIAAIVENQPITVDDIRRDPRSARRDVDEREGIRTTAIATAPCSCSRLKLSRMRSRKPQPNRRRSM